VEALSLELDLGYRGEEERRTGEVVLRWIQERVFLSEAGFGPRSQSTRFTGGNRWPVAAAQGGTLPVG
jgi:hypothetical protein